MSDKVEKYLENVFRKVGTNVVKELSDKYGFKYEEALKHLNLGEIKVEKEDKSKGCVSVSQKFPLPFCGEKCEQNCNAIRLNHGLYTQCTNIGTEEEYNNIMCKTCINQMNKNSNRIPTYGYIDERITLGDNYTDPKGKSPVSYGNIMKKLNITREEAEKEAKKQGLKIPEKQFEIKIARLGRPKKDTTTVDTSGSEDEPPKKARGRPKKEKEIVNSSTGEDIIKELVNKAKISEKKDTSPTPSLSPDDEIELSGDEQELAVTKFKIKGETYLKSADNTIYDINTHEEVGTWNPETKEIEIE